MCPDHHTSPEGATNIMECACVSGYIKIANLTCRACTPGYRCPSDSAEIQCPLSTYSPAGSTNCTTCVANTYGDELALGACKSCPANSQGPAGSSAKSGCQCDSGYYRDINLNCQICPAGYKCLNNNLEACPKGYSSVLGSTTCTSCPQGSYADNVGLPNCITCPAGPQVVFESNVELFNEIKARAETSNLLNRIFVQRYPLPTSAAAFNITKWSFYANQACTVTPVILQTIAPVGLGGYQDVNVQVSVVGTTRTVSTEGAYSFDFKAGEYILSKQMSLVSGTSTYNNLEYLGWYYSGAACIPSDTGAAESNALLDYVVSVHSYDTTAAINTQVFTNNVDLTAARATQQFSVSLNYSIATTTFSTQQVASTSIWNCSCGSNLRTLSDGNCQGLCVDGYYMASDAATACTGCPQGSFCTRSARNTCPTQQSSLPLASQCQACPGPDTHTNISQAMCGLRTCPAPANLVAISTTGWRALGRITLGLGGNGVIPPTHWFSGFKCLGLVLEPAADRPVSFIQQAITVVPGQTYAVRYKIVCTGLQCGASFRVSWLETNTVFSEVSFVHRAWTEGATPYFTPTGTTATLQFRGQMVTSSCTLWLAQIELVNLGRWTTSSMSSLRLMSGVDLPVRFSAAYVEQRSLISMQITGDNWIQQQAGVVAGTVYELMYWYTGSVVAQVQDGADWTTLTAMPPYETGVTFTQAIYQLTPTSSPVVFRFRGAGQMTNPSFMIFADRATAPCRHCLANFWCAGTTLNRCPLNTISPVGSLTQTDCYCAPGWYGSVALDNYTGFSPCAVCPMNSYCNGGNQKAFCPAGTKSQPGVNISGCLPCAEGEFCANGMVGVCPANSWSPTGSDDIADCGCMPGYHGVNGNCSLCESGFYCPGGPAPIACTANAVSPIGSTEVTQCFCDRGYYGVNNTPCTACQEGYWCWTGIRNLCPPNMWSPTLSSYQSNCTCNAGYTGPDGGGCSSCSPGFYKPMRGPATCTACPVGTSSNTVAAISAATCANCARGSYNMFTGQSTCTLCDAGTSASNFGSVQCSFCQPGTWSAQGAATCTPCPAGTFSVSTGAPNVAACNICPAGAYSAAGSTECEFCGACSFWTWPMRITLQSMRSPTFWANVGGNSLTMLTLASATTAIASDGSNLYRLGIDVNSTLLLDYDKRGNDPLTHISTALSQDSIYFVQGGLSFRFSLPILEFMNSYGDAGALGITEASDGGRVWVTYPTYMVSYRKDTESIQTTVSYPVPSVSIAAPCVHPAHPNKIFVAGRVTAGVFGFKSYDTVTRTWATLLDDPSAVVRCNFAPNGQFVFLTTTSSVFVFSMTESTLDRIYLGTTNGMLVDPLAGFVLVARQGGNVQRQRILIEDARNCGPGRYNINGGLQSVAECLNCPAGSLCPSGSNITQCRPGTFSLSTGLREQGQCTNCPAGSFCVGATARQLCPLGSYSLATGVTRVQDCGRCPAGFWCPNATVLRTCPPNTNSPAGSSDLGQCTCNAGYRCEVTKVVHAEVTLPISVADFNALRLQYIQAVAAAAGVSVSQVVIVSVTSATSSTGGARRRMLSAGEMVEIHTSIYNSQFNDKPHLALASLQRHLKLRGLPAHQPTIRVTLHNEVKSSSKALEVR